MMQPDTPTPDTRIPITGDRLHDKVNSAVNLLLEQKILFQLDGVLVRRKSPGAQQVVVVTESWMNSLLRQQFEFEQNGEPVEPPPARFIFARWRQFPAVLKTGRDNE